MTEGGQLLYYDYSDVVCASVCVDPTGAGVEWTLDASLDGTAWRTVHEGSLKSGEPAGALFELDAAVVAAVSPVRFLRLHTRGGTGGGGAGGARRQSHFVEIELYGAVVGGVSEPLCELAPPPRWAAAAAAAAAAQVQTTHHFIARRKKKRQNPNFTRLRNLALLYRRPSSSMQPPRERCGRLALE